LLWNFINIRYLNSDSCFELNSNSLPSELGRNVCEFMFHLPT
jgi:hypothetical protein